MDLILATAVIFIILAVLSALKLKRPKQDANLAFEPCKFLFSPAERSFLGVLEQSLDSSYRVFGKVRLADVVLPVKNPSRSNRTTALNKISQKHLDFVICSASDLAIVGVVELDDKSHNRKDRAERDGFVDTALASAKIPVLHIPARKGYELQDVRLKLAEAFKIGMLPSVKSVALGSDSVQPGVVEAAEKMIHSPIEAAPICPKCEAEMVKRQAKTGPHAGKWFWACPAFPKCRQVVQIA